MIALKTAPRLEKERALQREGRPIHRVKNLGGILRILLGSKPQEMQLSSGSAKWDVGYFHHIYVDQLEIIFFRILWQQIDLPKRDAGG